LFQARAPARLAKNRRFFGVSKNFVLRKIWGNGNLTCTGTKNALVNICEEAVLLRDPEELRFSRTSSYGRRKLYAVEGTTNIFTDEGKANTTNGSAVVYLDPVYMET